ncbi:MAG: 3-phosphoshikimate 1-carboxyvinyltransferase [Proteobacteria bacterium]|nr:3-phosphoshikimate 1-carboxyvinyltransferase [Pseudomonadota bacterium]
MKHVTPGTASGTLNAPPSKSMAQRAIALATLIPGENRIQLNTRALCDDIESALGAALALGAGITRHPNELVVHSGVNAPQVEIPCGESGLCLRMFSAIAALEDRPHRLVARGSLLRRPVDMVVAPLRALGATCHTEGGFPPLDIQGPLRGTEVAVDGTTSSQFLTGLLMAATRAAQPLRIQSPGLKSRPYVQMTLDLLRSAGAQIEADERLENYVVAGNTAYAPLRYQVPGDWSGAAFLLVAGALSGPVSVCGLNVQSTQADRAILDALAQCGARVHIDGDCVTVRRGALQAFDFDAAHCPDLFPPLVALAANAAGTSRIAGVHRLATKESDRAQTLQSEFGHMGIALSVQDDTLHITGGRPRAATVDAHGDHRIAMACAVAALPGEGPLSIRGDDAVHKSYPGFFSDLTALGVHIS